MEKDHGRIATRRYDQSVELYWFAYRAHWAGLQSVGMVEATRQVGGQSTVERCDYPSSLPLGAPTFARAIRGHGGVENQLDWVLAVWFRGIRAGRVRATRRRSRPRCADWR